MIFLSEIFFPILQNLGLKVSYLLGIFGAEVNFLTICDSASTPAEIRSCLLGNYKFCPSPKLLSPQRHWWILCIIAAEAHS